MKNLAISAVLITFLGTMPLTAISETKTNSSTEETIRKPVETTDSNPDEQSSTVTTVNSETDESSFLPESPTTDTTSSSEVDKEEFIPSTEASNSSNKDIEESTDSSNLSDGKKNQKSDLPSPQSKRTDKLFKSTQNFEAIAPQSATNGNFLLQAKLFSENKFGSAVEVLNWLNTYTLFSLGGIRFKNISFTGSLAALGGGVTVDGQPITIIDSPNSVYGSIINGPIYTNVNISLDSVSVDKGILSDYSLKNQVGWDSARPTGPGSISGLSDEKVKSFSSAMIENGMTIDDFKTAVINASEYLDHLGLQEGYPIATNGNPVISKDQKYLIETQPNTYVYRLELKNDAINNMTFSGFSKNDTVIVNVVDKSGNVVIGGGYPATDANVLWNFPTAISISNSTDFKGKILSPYASVNSNQNIDGGMFLDFGGGTTEKRRIYSEQTISLSVGDLLKEKIENERDFVTAITNSDGTQYDKNIETQNAEFKSLLKNVTFAYMTIEGTPITKEKIDTSKPGKYYLYFYYNSNTKNIFSVTNVNIDEREEPKGFLALQKVPDLVFGSDSQNKEVTKIVDKKNSSGEAFNVGEIQKDVKYSANDILKVDGQKDLENLTAYVIGYNVDHSKDTDDFQATKDGNDEAVLAIEDTRNNGNWQLSVALGNFYPYPQKDDSNTSDITGVLNLGLYSDSGLLQLTSNDKDSQLVSPADKKDSYIYKVNANPYSDGKGSSLVLNNVPAPTEESQAYHGTVTWTLSDTLN